MKGPSRSSIVVVAVTYESDESALQFVRNVSAVSNSDCVSIVIADNSERGDSRALFDGLLNENPSVLCVKPAANLGYFGGANFGFQEYLKCGQDFDWVIIANVDIEFDEDFFARLRQMESVDGLGVVAPSIWSKKSFHDQNPKMLHRPSKRKMKFYRLMYRSVITMNIYGLFALVKHSLTYSLLKIVLPLRLRGTRKGHPVPEKDVCPNGWESIYASQGACVVFSRRYFDCGGSLDYPMFLFYEEIFVAETARRLGLSIIYNPSLRIFHEDHLSTGLFRSRKIGAYVSKSVNYIVDTYFE
jgi:GT2 family glycosyltransferase